MFRIILLNIIELLNRSLNILLFHNQNLNVDCLRKHAHATFASIFPSFTLCANKTGTSWDFALPVLKVIRQQRVWRRRSFVEQQSAGRLAYVNCELVMLQDYIFCRLMRSGLLAEGSDTAASKLSDVSRELQVIGARLETVYPSLYQNVSRQVNIALKVFQTVRTQST